MQTNNQLEALNPADRSAGAGATARRALYHPAAVRRLGRVLRGRYRLESLLGMGAMGEVYRAVDLQLEQPCAVKLVFPGAVFSLHAHRRFVNEARVVARLFHPNIVDVRDFNEDADGTKFLVMELLEGQDLHELLSHKGKLPLQRAIEIVRSVGAALQYAHDMGVVHRDVKPNNIFLSGRAWRDGRAPRELGEGEGEQIKVLDFGLAKLLTDPAGEADSELGSGAMAQLTQGIIIGTPAYLSPEATAMDSAGVDARSDQWSLAVVAYQLLSGRLPFGNPNPYRLCQMICSEEPVRLRTLVPTLPEHIDSAIHTALSKQRENRFPKVLEFLRSLGNLPSLGNVGKDHSPARITWNGRFAMADALNKTLAAEGGAIDGVCAEHQAGAEFSEPTQVEPYLPGLTRPRLALLAPGQTRPGGVPEFVEPDRELCSLRVATSQPTSDCAAGPKLTPPEQERPNPDLLVTAHYTAEQLVELSQMTSARGFAGLVQAAQDVPTAPYRFGARSALQREEAQEQTPLPIPRPLLSEQSVPVVVAAEPSGPAPLPPLPECPTLMATLIPASATLLGETERLRTIGEQEVAPLVAKSTRTPAVREVRSATPPKPPREAFAEPSQLKTVLLGPRAAATLATMVGKDAMAFQTMHVVHSPVFQLATAPLVPLVRPPVSTAMAPELPQLNSTLLQLQMPPLLTHSGTRPPELGFPLLFTPPRRRALWRTVGAGSVVLGIVIAVLLGLRLARARTMTHRATQPSRRAALTPVAPRRALAPAPIAELAEQEQERRHAQSLPRAQVKVQPPLQTLAYSFSPPR